MEIKNVLSDYKKDLVFKGSSKHTLWVYLKDIKKLVDYFNIQTSKELEIEPLKLNEFYQSLTDLKPSSVNGLMRSLSTFYNWLKEMNIIENNYTLMVRYLKVPKRTKVVLTDEEAIQLIKNTKDMQVKLMLAIMWTTGVRRDTICNIKLRDIQGCHILVSEKGNSQRTILLDETVCHLLNIYMATRKSDSQYLFYATRGETSNGGALTGTSVNNRVKSAMKESGLSEEKIKSVTAHRIRGSAITSVISQYGLNAGMKFANHVSLTTTQIYNATGAQLVDSIIKERGEQNKSILEGIA